MAEPRKTKRPAKPKEGAKATERKKTATPRTPRLNKAALDELTPDRLRTLWALHHPDRPEVRAGLERVYRRSPSA